MHREGAWTPGTDDEIVRRLRPTDWPKVAREGACLAAGSGLAAYLATFVSAPVVVGAGVFLVGGVGLATRHIDDRKLEDRERVLALREEFGIGPVWIVDLIVRQGEAPTGRDQGLMWLEGGRVMYSGLRTSFALAPEQAAQAVHHEGGYSGLKLRLNLELARETPAGPLSLSFWPITTDGQRAENEAEALRYALNTVLEAGRWTKRPELGGQWPPIAIGPGAPHPTELRRAALLRVGAWTAVGAWVGICVAMESPLIGLAVFLIVAAVMNWLAWTMNAPRWKAYRDARKVWGEA